MAFIVALIDRVIEEQHPLSLTADVFIAGAFQQRSLSSSRRRSSALCFFGSVTPFGQRQCPLVAHCTATT